MLDFINKITTKNLYLALLIVQVIDLFNGLVFGGLVIKNLVQVSQMNQAILQTLLITLANSIALILVRRFIKNNFIFILFTILLAISIVCIFMTESPANTQLTTDTLITLRKAGFTFQIFSLLMILWVFVRDIFEFKHDLTYCLTGACSLFILIGTLFGCGYSLFYTLFPTLMEIPAGSNVIIPCLNYSFCILAGQDPAIVVDPIIKNLSYFESIFSNLYAVVVVGRLLTK